MLIIIEFIYGSWYNEYRFTFMENAQMKYVFFTDIHGSYTAMKKAIEITEREGATNIVFLGDLYYHGPRNPLPEEYNPMKVCEAVKSLDKPNIIIKGNCDAEIDEMITEREFLVGDVIEVDGKTILLTHGHHINADKPSKCKFSSVIHGHTHVNSIKTVDGVVYVNVASLSMPKMNAPKSYAVYENKVITIKDVDGSVLMSTEI